MSAIGFSLLFLVMLFGMILAKSSGAFLRTEIALEIDLTNEANLAEIDHRQIIKKSLKAQFPEAQTVKEINALYQILSKLSNLDFKNQLNKNPELLGKKSLFWLSASSKVDMFFKHKNHSSLKENQLSWLNKLESENKLRTVLNWKFFQFADSREPEIAGIGAGLTGSIFVMLIFLSFAFPIGVMCAFYLEEFAKKNRFTDIIEISINNLAAIPSIIYGLLGLTLYLQFMNLPRSSSLVGGMTLFMLVLPVIIIATRNTIRSIPSSIRDAASALGASKMQITLHHLLPLSIPGIMTGTILAMSRALGETAPLLMIGMVAFIADIPQNFFDPTTVLPVQIYLWSDSPEVGFAEKTAAAILVLLGFLILFNLAAVILRKKFERKW
jgi:phosphate transport system permease protein